MIHIGIDYSMTSPAVCIHDGENYYFHYLTSVKKYIGNFDGRFFGDEYPEWTEPEQRFNNISQWVIRSILKHTDAQFGLNSPMKVTIEGYSMGSKGKVFHIAENTGLLKFKLWEKNIAYETPAPTTIKKFATGKGNADQARMYECFVSDTGWDLELKLGGLRTSNPISDIVDSYFICNIGMEPETSE